MKRKKMSFRKKIITLFIICFGLSKTVRTQQCFWLFCLLFPHCHSFHFGSTKWINNNKTKEESIKDTHQQTNKQTQNLWLYLFHLATVQKVFKSILCVTNKQTTLHSPVMLRQGTIIDCKTEYRTYGMYTKEYYITRKKWIKEEAEAKANKQMIMMISIVKPYIHSFNETKKRNETFAFFTSQIFFRLYIPVGWLIGRSVGRSLGWCFKAQ